jgi:glycosyltransferase involved in cell wall biosynthesis
MSKTRSLQAMLESLGHLPEAIIRAGAASIDRAPRMLTPVYGSLRQSFSGSTWYLAQAGMAEAALDGAFTLNGAGTINPRLKLAGALWKTQRLLRGKRFGGFKFAGLFSDVLWAQHAEQLAGTVVINNTQIFGRTFLRRFQRLGITPCFYIDGTLTEYFYGYGTVEEQTIGADVVKRAIELEREGYASAARIMTMSHATARALSGTYGVPAERIHVVLPGANIDDSAIPAPSPHKGRLGRDFTLGFVGLFPQRKGLDKLADALGIVRGRGLPVRLVVIGKCPDVIAAQDGVDFLGVINKEQDTERFVSALRAVDLGCQLSRVELLGIAMLEFMRLGVPVMATATGGMPDVLEDGGGILVPPEVSPEELADIVQELVLDEDRYDALRQQAVGRATWAGWRRAARDMDHCLSEVA